jgi:hypothetical protein
LWGFGVIDDIGKKEPRMVSHTGRINWCCHDDQSEAQELHLYLRVFKARRPAVRRSSRNLLSACGCRFQRHASFSCNGHGFKTTAKCTQQEQLEGLEPSFPAWKAGTLPLCYSRIVKAGESLPRFSLATLASPTNLQSTSAAMGGQGFSKRSFSNRRMAYNRRESWLASLPLIAAICKSSASLSSGVAFRFNVQSSTLASEQGHPQQQTYPPSQ